MKQEDFERHLAFNKYELISIIESHEDYINLLEGFIAYYIDPEHLDGYGEPEDMIEGTPYELWLEIDKKLSPEDYE